MSKVESPSPYKNYAEVRQHGKNENQRPWDFLEVAQRFIPQNGIVLDVGTGTSFKLVELQKRGLTNVSFVAFDNQFNFESNGNDTHRVPTKLLSGAIDEVSASPAKGKIQLLAADSYAGIDRGAFPFANSSFDAVTFMLAAPNPQEAFRVLKPGGVVIMEIVGEQDKLNIKKEFGSDDEGRPRGYKMEYGVNTLLPIYREDFETSGFSTILQSSGSWETRYTPDEIKELLKLLGNRLIKGYDEKEDVDIVDKLIKKLSYKRGPHTGMIKTNQHRLLYVGQKPLE